MAPSNPFRSMGSVVRYLVPFAVIAVAAVGCGSSDDQFPRASVAGSVVLDGLPVPEGVLKFTPLTPADGPTTVVPFEAGRFEVSDDLGPIIGQHRVDVVSTDDGGIAFDDEAVHERLAAMKNPPKLQVVTVPAMYERDSPLRADVTAEAANEFLFELQTPRRLRR